MNILRALLFCACFVLVACTYKDHKYADGDDVLLYVNKVGPIDNPQETYLYYKLPWCIPPGGNEEAQTPREGLGEALLGYELRMSGISVKFKKDVDRTPLCSNPSLTSKENKQLRNAVLKHYWYQMFLDDLPIYGTVGWRDDTAATTENTEKTKIPAYILTHKKFTITYNDDRVIQVNLTCEEPVMLEERAKIDFTYSVEWYKTDIEFDDRFLYYLDEAFFEHQIHWFSIFNSFMMVIFLVGLVSMILMRTLRRDYAKYSKDDDIEDDVDVGDESGWKQIHGDVFRAPPHLLLFSSLVGTGHQLCLLVGLVIIFSILGNYYRTRGSMVTAFVILYAFTSFIGGYASGGFYARNGGKNWIKSMLFTGGLFPGVMVATALTLNFIAIAYGSLAAFPAGTIVAILAIWGFICYPMTFIGAVIGKNWNGQPNAPCRINPTARSIPEKKWYLHPIVNIFLGGILPFGSIFIEMYFIFTSFWLYKYYYVYGFMLLVYIILIIVTICVTIVSTYFLLNSEDYRWQWTSFLSAASTALYVYLYSVYYFFAKTKMFGFFQTVFYFGYMAMFSIGLGILCGAIGFIGTSIFVRRIYQNVKID